MKIYLKAKNSKGEHGFTLIEVMLGMLILAILAVTAVAALRHPHFMVVSTAHKQAAIHAANEALEEAYSLGYSNLAEGTSPVTPVGDYSVNGRPVDVVRGIELLGGAGGVPEYKRITVSVAYPGADAPVVLETIITP